MEEFLPLRISGHEASSHLVVPGSQWALLFIDVPVSIGLLAESPNTLFAAPPNEI